MKHYQYLVFLVFALTACNARPPKTSVRPTVRPPVVELLIAPVSEASATPWLSDMASTIKAKIETKEAATPALSWYDESTPTPEIYMPKKYLFADSEFVRIIRNMQNQRESGQHDLPLPREPELQYPDRI